MCFFVIKIANLCFKTTKFAESVQKWQFLSKNIIFLIINRGYAYNDITAVEVTMVTLTEWQKNGAERQRWLKYV